MPATAPTTPAAAPAAPSKPAPAAPPAPSPKPATPTPPPEKTEAYADAFADLDQIDQGKKPTPKREAAKVPPSKDGATDGQESLTDGDGAPEGQSAANAEGSSKEGESDSSQNLPSGEQVEGKPVKAKELRLAYEGLKKRVKEEYEPQLTQLKAKVQELETGNGNVPKEVQEKIANYEKRNAELEQHIRFVDYQKSSEYQEKFWKPYVEAWSSAVQELAGLVVNEENKETGEVTPRPVTEADLQYYAALKPSDRRQLINKLFPEDKEEVKRHINEISRLYEASQMALNKAKQDADNQLKTQADQQRQFQQQRAQLWKESNDTLAQRYPQWFAPVENDTEGNTILSKGKALSDLVFSPQDLTPESVDLLPKVFGEAIKARKSLTPDQIIRLHSIVRNKAANHDRLAHQLNAATQRIAELEASLKQYEESSPDNVAPASRTRTPNKGYMQDAAEELEVLDKKYAA